MSSGCRLRSFDLLLYRAEERRQLDSQITCEAPAALSSGGE